MISLFNFLKTRIFPRFLFPDKGDISKRVAILNFSYSNSNFGAVLLSYATQKMLINLGKVPYVLNFNPEFKNYWKFSHIKGMISGMNFISFRYKFLNTTKIYTSLKSVEKSNRFFNAFIFGSDQIWRYEIIKSDYETYFGGFVDSGKRLIAYAASFGKDKWDEAPKATTKHIGELLKRFSRVSVREQSGVNICKNVFGINAEFVLDPTLLLKDSDYAQIYETHKIKISGKYISTAFLDRTPIKFEISKAISELTQLKPIDATAKRIKIFGKMRPIYRPVSDWLYLIKNAEFVITDSFHCCVFCIIFKKQFLCIDTKNRGNARLESLFKMLEIPSRMAFTEQDALKLFNEKIDFEKVDKNLNILRNKSIDFLNAAFCQNI